MIRFENVQVKPSEIRVEDWYADLAAGIRDMDWFNKEFERQKEVVQKILETSIHDQKFNNVLKVHRNTSLYYRYFGLQKVMAVSDLVKTEFFTRRYGKLVVFGVNRDVIMYFRELLSAYFPVTLFPRTPPSKWEMNLKKFATIPRHRIMVLNSNIIEMKTVEVKCDEVIILESNMNPFYNAKALKCLKYDGDLLVRTMSIPGTIDEEINHKMMERTKEILESGEEEPILKPRQKRSGRRVSLKKIMRQVSGQKTKKQILANPVVEDPVKESIISAEKLIIEPEIKASDILAMAKRVMEPRTGEPSYNGIEKVAEILRTFGVRSLSRLQPSDYKAFMSICESALEEVKTTAG